jgi:hypothetical protein
MLPLGLASKLGLHPVAIAHLSPPDTSSSLVVSQISTGGSKDVIGRAYTNEIHFCPMFYICMMDKGGTT